MPDRVTGLMRVISARSFAARARLSRTDKKSSRHLVRDARGNVVTMMLVGLGMAATLSVVSYQLLTGPVATVSRVTQSNMAITQMLGAGQMLALDAANQAPSGDCDGDGYVEPRGWVTPLTGLTGGGALPAATGLPTRDPWKTTLGYCVWDMGAVFESPDCGGPGANRLNGADVPGGASETPATQTVFAVISAGPNRRFETVCRNWNNADDVIVASGDDIIKRYTYQEAATATSAFWDLRADDTDSSQLLRKAEIGNQIKMDNTQGLLQTGLIQTSGKAIADGGLELGVADGVVCGPAGANEGLMRAKPTLMAGMAAHWKMDEVSGTLVSEATGAFPGSWTGTPATIASTAGQVGTAFHLNGAAQVSATDPGVSKLDFAVSDSIGISAWVWFSSLSAGVDTVISKGTAPTNFTLEKGPTQRLLFRYSHGPALTATFRAPGSVPYDRWVHVAFTYTYGDPASAKMYFDGVVCGGCSWASAPDAALPPLQNNNPVIIGGGGLDRVDDLRVYRRLLSATDVQNLYNYSGGGAALPSELVAYWQFDETSGVNAADLAGTSSGTMAGGDWTTATTPGKSGGGFLKSSGVTLTATPSSSNVSDIFVATGGSVSIWFKTPDPAAATGRYVETGPATGGWFLSRTANRFRLTTKSGGGDTQCQSPTVTITPNVWHHLVAVGGWDFYLDGFLIGGFGMCTGMGGVSSGGLSPITIGGLIDGDSLDDVRFYNRALDAAEILQIYNDGATEFGIEGSGVGGDDDEGIVVQFCNGSAWQDMSGGGGSGGLKASFPPGACTGSDLGEVRYISGFVYFCDGKEWRTF